jgi:xanthine dehydrogenase iron-sulfur cluster and FAD-binding subunit A
MRALLELAGLIVGAVWLSATNESWAQYLTGKDRANFVTGVMDMCLRPDNPDPLTAEIPLALFNGYCRCYANGMANRISRRDIQSDNRALADPIAQDVSKRCYETMRKIEALKQPKRPQND